MIYALERPLWDCVIPLFETMWFDRAFVGAVLAGTQPGRVVVDDPDQPRAAMLAHSYEHFVVGEVAEPFRAFVRDAPTESDVFDDVYGFCPANPAWDAAILADFGASLEVVGRRGFRYESGDVVGWRALLPDSARIVPIDRDLADRIAAAFPYRAVTFTWNTVQAFLTHSFGCCLLVEGEIASVAFAGAVGWGEANFDVETAEKFRRRGFARLTCAAVIEQTVERNLTPTWDTDTTNPASAQLALSLGFTEHAPFQQISPPYDRDLPRTEGRWRAVDSPPAHTTAWQRV